MGQNCAAVGGCLLFLRKVEVLRIVDAPGPMNRDIFHRFVPGQVIKSEKIRNFSPSEGSTVLPAHNGPLLLRVARRSLWDSDAEKVAIVDQTQIPSPHPQRGWGTQASPWPVFPID